MLLLAHHVMFDGSSYKLFIDDIGKAYAGEILTPENYNAIDFAVDEENLRNESSFQKAEDWHKEKFSGRETNSLPLGDLKAESSYDFYMYDLNIKYSELQKFCRENQISETALTSGVLGFMLGTYTNTKEALFYTIYHARTPKIAKTAGMFIKTMPIFCQWNHDTNIKDFLKTQREFIKSSRKYDIYSLLDFGKICDVSELPVFVWQGNVVNLTNDTFAENLAHEIF